MKQIYLLLLLCTAVMSPALAQQNTWTGATSTAWNTPGNWSGNAVPTAMHDVIIPDRDNDPIIGTATAIATSVVVESGAVLTIQNTGSLTLSWATFRDGLSATFFNNGTVNNSGKLVIADQQGAASVGLYNKAIFNNNAGGEIKIDNVAGEYGLYNHPGGVFTNGADIIIGATNPLRGSGLYNAATFHNTAGQIKMDRAFSQGLDNAAGTFTNAAGIIIGATASAGRYGITNRATFINNPGGDIQIDNTTFWGLNNAAGTFTNAAGVTIGATAPVGDYGLYSLATFTNNTGGDIRIDRSTKYGLFNHDGTFTNAASIKVGSMASPGEQGIFNLATFINTTGGDIRIDRSTFRGLVNLETFTNAAGITIGSIAPVGRYGLYNQATFANNPGGDIQINRSTDSGVWTTNAGSFTNAASITIGAVSSVGPYSLMSGISFINKSCATLTLFAPVFINGVFTNNGRMTVNTAQANTANTDRFTNNGIIEYPQNNPIPNVHNNSLIIAPAVTCGFTAAPVLQIGDGNTLVVGTTWYKEAALTNAAGTYNAGTNTFQATGLAGGSTYPLYFTVTDPDNGCSQTVSVAVTLEALPAISFSPAAPVLTCADPTITLVASGGTAYQWEDGSTDASRTVSRVGTYSVTVTGANGCTSENSVVVSESYTTWYLDADNDGYYTGPGITQCASPGPGYRGTGLTSSGDCDDTRLLYADGDGDGFGAGTPVACGVATNTDCNDGNSDVNPTTVWYLDADDDGYYTGPGVTQCASPGPGYKRTGLTGGGDCDDASLLYADGDGDGFGAGAAIACGVANDTDCDDSRLLYADADGDGFGAGAAAACGVTNNTDCNDGNGDVNPTTVWYLDADDDGYYTGSGVTQCASPGPGYKRTGLTGGGDCDDASLLYADGDGDGFGAGAPVACGVANDTDCDDSRLLYADGDGDGFGAGAAVACGVANDTDCDDASLLYADGDGDGFGAGAPVACGVANKADCNDASGTVYPGATEICVNGIDDNCNGLIDENCGSVPRISVNNSTVYESEGVAVVTISSDRFSTSAISIKYATQAGTATGSGKGARTFDFTSASGSVTIAAGAKTAQLRISITKDNIAEVAESFNVNVSLDAKNAKRATITRSSGTVTINDGTRPALTGIQSAREAVQPAKEAVHSLALEALAYPNPSTSSFTLKVSSNDGKEAITMIVTDVNGRVMETRNNLTAGQTVQLGSGYDQGIYMVVIRQGTNRRQVKLFKAL